MRAAAVSSLAKIARSVDSLRPEILVLLRRCELDNDDEVRDRATMYTGLLTAEGEDASAGLALVKEGLPDGISVRALEKAVIAYQMRPTEGEMKISSLPIAVDASGSGEVGYESELVQSKAAIGVDESSDATGGASGDAGGNGPSSGGAASASTNYAAEIYQIQEFANLGKLYKSTRPVQLTEDEVEYTVQCVKHIFLTHCLAV